jgi:predicted Zn-dependent peptidase
MIKKVTKVVLVMIVLTWAQVTVAQNKMKAPERFKLKNGLTCIVAENSGLGKIYARITVENEISEEQKIYAQVFDAFLTNKANEFNEKQQGNGKISPHLTMVYNDVNTSSNIFSFEQTLANVSQIYFNPAIVQEVFADLKTKGNKEILAKITLSSLLGFHSAHFKASDIYITIAGDINPSDAKAITNRVFGDKKQDVFNTAE